MNARQPDLREDRPDEFVFVYISMQLQGQERPPRCGARNPPPPCLRGTPRLPLSVSQSARRKSPSTNPLSKARRISFILPSIFIYSHHPPPLLPQLREEAINADKAKKRQTKAPAFWAGREQNGGFSGKNVAAEVDRGIRGLKGSPCEPRILLASGTKAETGASWQSRQHLLPFQRPQ